MKNKPLYELNLPPASFFIGQFVRVLTGMEERDENGEVVGQITVIGLVVESDNTYLTLGEFSDLDETPIAKLAIKHSDIQMIQVHDPDSIEEDTLQTGRTTLN